MKSSFRLHNLNMLGIKFNGNEIFVKSNNVLKYICYFVIKIFIKFLKICYVLLYLFCTYRIHIIYFEYIFKIKIEI